MLTLRHVMMLFLALGILCGGSVYSVPHSGAEAGEADENAASEPDWGAPADNIQTAIDITRNQETGKVRLIVYARNTSGDQRVLDAKPLYTNNCRITVYDPAYSNTIGGIDAAAQVGYTLKLPAHRVRSWKWSWHEVKDDVAFVLNELSGRCVLVWKLDNAESAPLHLRVEDRRVTVYEDEWKSVKFRVRLPKRRSQ